MPLYNFDPGEEGENDWETELLDENFTNHHRQRVRRIFCNKNCLLLLKLGNFYLFCLIKPQYFQQGYQSMDNEENTELFSGH